MAGNANLTAAKAAKNDEFYTRYVDIEAEMNAYVEYDPDVFRGKTILLPCDDPEWSNFTRYFAANFDRFGIKKLISTSYARGAGNQQLTLFEESSPLYDAGKHETHGKLFTVVRAPGKSGWVDTDDIQFSGYLEGDGDFRSAEVTALRDEADVIITNPPFSLFREFLAWIMEAGKKFIIVGNMNVVTYKEVFPFIKNGDLWAGTTFNKIMTFSVPESYSTNLSDRDGLGRKMTRVPGISWLTNLHHGLRHQPLRLDTMEHNLKYNKKLRKKFLEEYGKLEYPRYDNYDAIEVPFVDAIPSDYEAGMGVPITFLDRYDPEQFELVGADFELAAPQPLPDGRTGSGRFYVRERERERRLYSRLVIRRKR